MLVSYHQYRSYIDTVNAFREQYSGYTRLASVGTHQHFDRLACRVFAYDIATACGSSRTPPEQTSIELEAKRYKLRHFCLLHALFPLAQRAA